MWCSDGGEVQCGVVQWGVVSAELYIRFGVV